MRRIGYYAGGCRGLLTVQLSDPGVLSAPQVRPPTAHAPVGVPDASGLRRLPIPVLVIGVAVVAVGLGVD